MVTWCLGFPGYTRTLHDPKGDWEKEGMSSNTCRARHQCMFGLVHENVNREDFSVWIQHKNTWFFTRNYFPLQLPRGVHVFPSSLLQPSSVKTAFPSSETNSYFPFPDFKITDKIIMQEDCYTSRLVLLYCYIFLHNILLL